MLQLSSSRPALAGRFWTLVVQYRLRRQSWQAPKAREVAYPLEGRIHRPRVLQARRVLLGPGVSCYLPSVNLSASRSTEQSIPRKAHGPTYQLPYRTTFLRGILRTLTIGGQDDCGSPTNAREASGRVGCTQMQSPRGGDFAASGHGWGSASHLCDPMATRWSIASSGSRSFMQSDTEQNHRRNHFPEASMDPSSLRCCLGWRGSPFGGSQQPSTWFQRVPTPVPRLSAGGRCLGVGVPNGSGCIPFGWFLSGSRLFSGLLSVFDE